MKQTILFIAMLISSICANAQEPAKYRISYDSSQEFKTGKKEPSRWNLDIGETSTIFYNANSRLFNSVKDSLRALYGVDIDGYMSALKAYTNKYPGQSVLQVLINKPEKGSYTCIDIIRLQGPIKYEDKMPQIEWQLVDSTKTICGYDCHKAIGKVGGREWAVWYAEDLPMQYGPYILSGLPGLILGASDSDGYFSFTAAGIENAPADAKIEMISRDEPQICSHKRFLEMRKEANGLSNMELAARAVQQYQEPGAKGVIRVMDTEGKDISAEVPKWNYLDRE